MKPWLLRDPYPQYGVDAPTVRPASAVMHGIDADKDRDVLVVGRDAGEFADLGFWLKSQGMPVRYVADISLLDRIASGDEPLPGLLFVDADSSGNLDGLIDRLLLLRRARPELPVILASVNFGRDDFDLSRISICDASVAWPVTFTRSEVAIAMAQANNRIWQEQNGPRGPNLN